MFKRIISALLLSGLLLLPGLAFAQQGTLLPEGDSSMSTESCINYLNNSPLTPEIYSGYEAEVKETVLACAIKTGRIRLWMMPYFVSYFANFFIGISGTVSLLFVVMGGFWYMTGGITDDKEKGKKTITYALMGMGITLLAWVIVNVIQVQITS